jgi:hypothetical protein
MNKVQIQWLVEEDHIVVDRHNYYLNHMTNKFVEDQNDD